METLTVALAANAAYADPLLVAMASMARCSSRPIQFVVLDGGLTDSQRQLIDRAVSANSSVGHKVRFTTVDDAAFRSFRLMNGNAMTYARLLLPEILPEDWVLYVDADTLWRGDAAQLWDMRDDSASAVATPDCADSASKDEGLCGEYFCAGIMLTNLKRWREEGVSAKCCAWLAEHPEARFWDQSALNRVLKGRVKLVDKAWNRYVGEAGECHVLHYAGANPWRFGIRKNRLDRYKWIWFRELAHLKGTFILAELLRAKFPRLCQAH